MLTGIAERRPLVLILDDLHWADRPTLLLLSFVLRGGRPAPLLVLGTYRDTEVGRRTPLAAALADLRRDGGAERIGLRGLAPGEVGELATAWLGAETAARVAGAVHARTGGNAFFVEEVLRGLADDDASVPESVRHAVGARLARLSPEADELLAVAAVLGLVVDAELLASVAGRPAAEVEPLLDELFEARLLLAREGRALEFPHALVREAVDRDLNPLRRARLHRAAAAALIARGEERHLAEIAHHLSEAADDRAAGLPAARRRGGAGDARLRGGGGAVRARAGGDARLRAAAAGARRRAAAGRRAGGRARLLRAGREPRPPCRRPGPPRPRRARARRPRDLDHRPRRARDRAARGGAGGARRPRAGAALELLARLAVELYYAPRATAARR